MTSKVEINPSFLVVELDPSSELGFIIALKPEYKSLSTSASICLDANPAAFGLIEEGDQLEPYSSLYLEFTDDDEAIAFTLVHI